MVAVAGAVGYLVQRQTLWLQAIKTRVGATTAMLKAMKSIKMSGMARTLSEQMRSFRDNEVRRSRGYRMLLTVITLLGLYEIFPPHITQLNFLVHANTFVTPVVALSMYNLIARQKEWTETLDSARAFTALAFLTILASSFVGFLQSLTELSTALGCIDSIRVFVLQPPRPEGRCLPEPYGLMLFQDPILSKASRSGHVVAKDVSLAWNDGTPILQDFSFVLNRGALVMVNGPVGSGKSMLLRAMLGEVPKVSGKLTVAARSFAYCAQAPWIVSGTIQENIRGPGNGVRSSPTWYATVLDACDLHKDLASLPEGDLTAVGGQGIGLSGGQQQRLVWPHLSSTNPKLTHAGWNLSPGSGTSNLLSSRFCAPRRCHEWFGPGHRGAHLPPSVGTPWFAQNRRGDCCCGIQFTYVLVSIPPHLLVCINHNVTAALTRLSNIVFLKSQLAGLHSPIRCLQ